jgi:hypothetical protein
MGRQFLEAINSVNYSISLCRSTYSVFNKKHLNILSMFWSLFNLDFLILSYFLYQQETSSKDEKAPR